MPSVALLWIALLSVALLWVALPSVTLGRLFIVARLGVALPCARLLGPVSTAMVAAWRGRLLADAMSPSFPDDLFTVDLVRCLHGGGGDLGVLR